MLPGVSLPACLTVLLSAFAGCFTAPTFATFAALVTGFVRQTGAHTVCGMLTGAGLERVWHHSRAHRFFSQARWSPDQVGLVLADLIVAHLVPAGAALTVAIDDTLFHRFGKKVHAASWLHDGSAKGPRKIAWGNNWVITGLVVTVGDDDPPGMPAHPVAPMEAERRHQAGVGPPAHRHARRPLSRPGYPRRGRRGLRCW